MGLFHRPGPGAAGYSEHLLAGAADQIRLPRPGPDPADPRPCRPDSNEPHPLPHRHHHHRHAAPGQLRRRDPSGGPGQPPRRHREFLLPGRLPRPHQVDEPSRIQRSTLEIAACWLAAGLDPERVFFYRQSDIPEIPELTWLLTCVTGKGLLNRAHAYKASVDKNVAAGDDPDADVTAGLFMYPVLMAADILMFKAHQDPRRPRPGAAHRDGAGHGAKLQPCVWRALRRCPRRPWTSRWRCCPAWTGAR